VKAAHGRGIPIRTRADGQVKQHDSDILPLPRFHLRAGAGHVAGQAIDPRADDGVARLQIGQHYLGDRPFGQ
jgi:hypothetical protein